MRPSSSPRIRERTPEKSMSAGVGDHAPVTVGSSSLCLAAIVHRRMERCRHHDRVFQSPIRSHPLLHSLRPRVTRVGTAAALGAFLTEAPQRYSRGPKINNLWHASPHAGINVPACLLLTTRRAPGARSPPPLDRSLTAAQRCAAASINGASVSICLSRVRRSRRSVLSDARSMGIGPRGRPWSSRSSGFAS